MSTPEGSGPGPGPLPLPLGTRITADSHSGTVVYAGTRISLTQPNSLFYGIDWDDYRSRGKHNGVANSIQHFQLPLPSASFIHSKKATPSSSLLNQALLKYTSILTALRPSAGKSPLLTPHNIEHLYSQLLQHHRQRLSKYDTDTSISKTTGVHLHQLDTYNNSLPSLLTIKRVTLESANIAYILSPAEQWIHSTPLLACNHDPQTAASPHDLLSTHFEAQQVSSFLPNLIELSLPHNLFTCLCHLPYLLAIFPTLKSVNLSENPITIQLPSTYPHFPLAPTPYSTDNRAPVQPSPPPPLINPSHYYHLMPPPPHNNIITPISNVNQDLNPLNPLNQPPLTLNHQCYLDFLHSLSFHFTSTDSIGQPSQWTITSIDGFPWLSFLRHDPCACKHSHSLGPLPNVNSPKPSRPSCISFITDKLQELALSSIPPCVREKQHALSSSITPTNTNTNPDNSFNTPWHWVLLLASQGALPSLTKLELLNNDLSSLYDGCATLDSSSPPPIHPSHNQQQPPHLFDIIYLPTSDMQPTKQHKQTERNTNPVFPSQFFPSLQHILLNENKLQWDSVNTLSHCPKLEFIELNDNNVSSIPLLSPHFPFTSTAPSTSHQPQHTPYFPSLRRLLLDSNPLQTLASIHNLRSIPTLSILSALPPRDENDSTHAFDEMPQDNRLDDVNFFSTPQHAPPSPVLNAQSRFSLSSDLLRQLTILALPSLQVLNSKSISVQERNNVVLQTLPPLVDFVYQDIITLLSQHPTPSPTESSLKNENHQDQPAQLSTSTSSFQALSRSFSILHLLQQTPSQDVDSNSSPHNSTPPTAISSFCSQLEHLFHHHYQLHHFALGLPPSAADFVQHAKSTLSPISSTPTPTLDPSSTLLPPPPIASDRVHCMTLLVSSLLLDIAISHHLTTPSTTTSSSSPPFILSQLLLNTPIASAGLLDRTSPLTVLPNSLQSFTTSHHSKLVKPLLLNSPQALPDLSSSSSRLDLLSTQSFPPHSTLATCLPNTKMLLNSVDKSHDDAATADRDNHHRADFLAYCKSTQSSLIHLVVDWSSFLTALPNRPLPLQPQQESTSIPGTEAEDEQHQQSFPDAGSHADVLSRFVAFINASPQFPFLAPLSTLSPDVSHTTTDSPDDSSHHPTTSISVPFLFTLQSPINLFNTTISHTLNLLYAFWNQFTHVPPIPAHFDSASPHTQSFSFQFYSQWSPAAQTAYQSTTTPTNLLRALHPASILSLHTFTSTFHHLHLHAATTHPSSFTTIDPSGTDPSTNTRSLQPADASSPTSLALSNLYSDDLLSIFFDKAFVSTHNDVLLLTVTSYLPPPPPSICLQQYQRTLATFDSL